MPLALNTLWNFSDPAASEAAFSAALAGAPEADQVILGTQIARTWGLRRDFVRARTHLEALADRARQAGGEALARWHLEWGRTWASAAHGPEAVTAADRARAAEAYEAAFAAAQGARLDGLAVDALHMLAFLDPDPAAQIEPTRRALAFLLASDQPEARSWEPSVRNNLGMAFHGAGRLEEALAEFQAALHLRQAQGPGEPERIARWMVAWTLRGLGRTAEALALQEALEEDCVAAKAPDPYVFEELELLYELLGRPRDAARAARLHRGQVGPEAPDPQAPDFQGALADAVFAPSPEKLALVLASYAAADRGLLVGRLDGRAVAVLGWRVHEGVEEIGHLGVEASARGAGWGRALVEKLGTQRPGPWAVETDAEAEGFYEKLGFKVQERTPAGRSRWVLSAGL